MKNGEGEKGRRLGAKGGNENCLLRKNLVSEKRGGDLNRELRRIRERSYKGGALLPTMRDRYDL